MNRAFPSAYFAAPVSFSEARSIFRDPPFIVLRQALYRTVPAMLYDNSLMCGNLACAHPRYLPLQICFPCCGLERQDARPAQRKKQYQDFGGLAIGVGSTAYGFALLALQNRPKIGVVKVDLLSYVLGQLHAHEGPLSRLAKEAGVKQSWLSSFFNGAIPDPGVRKIQRLADYFDQRSTAKSRAARVEAHLDP